jgi:hypothetical protein
MAGISTHGRIWLVRFWLTAALAVTWALCVVYWTGHPNGAARVLMGLLSFAGLGAAAWIAPISRRGPRIVLRMFGVAMGLAALAAYIWLVIALRNGL